MPFQAVQKVTRPAQVQVGKETELNSESITNRTSYLCYSTRLCTFLAAHSKIESAIDDPGYLQGGILMPSNGQSARWLWQSMKAFVRRLDRSSHHIRTGIREQTSRDQAFLKRVIMGLGSIKG